MDILITCITYIFFTGSLIYIVLVEKGKKKRKHINILEAHFENWTAFIFWVICFLANTLFTLGYYIKFFSNDLHVISYLVTAIVFSCPLLLVYYLERWKVIIDGDCIIKYGLFTKKVYVINDITQIKISWFFTIKYYINGKKIFSISPKYHDYSRTFENKIKEKSNRKEEKI